MRTSHSALLMPRVGGLAAVGDVHAAVEAAERRDDLLDLGVEVLELALVGGDLLFEGRLADAGGVAHGRSMARASLGVEVLRCVLFSFEL